MIRASRRASVALALADAASIGGAFALAYWVRFHLGWFAAVDVPAPSWSEYGEALGVLLIIFGIVFRARGLYESFPARGIDVLERTLNAVHLATLIVLAASFFDRAFSYSRTVLILTWAQAIVLLPGWRLLLLATRRRSYARGVGLVPALVVGSGASAAEVYQRLAGHRRYGLDVKGIVLDEAERPPGDPDPDPENVLGRADQLEAIVASTGAREVLIAETSDRLRLLGLLERCDRIGVETRVVPQLYDLFITPDDLSELNGVPFVAVREHRGALLSLAFKRMFDIAVALVLLLPIAPVIAVLALLVRRESEGPALFRQRRVGQSGNVFEMWKLRTMVVDAEERLKDLVDLDSLEQPVYKLDDDPRVTRIGRLLRRWSLDELPQVWNVLVGQMSLVGPRPEVEEVVERYDAHHRRRLKAKPGLTGLQQVEARAAADLDDRVRLDVYYISRRSFLFDLYILARTPWAVVHGRGAV